jgi:hypothetical protein
MIRHRNASACDDFARRTHRASCSRSSPVSSSGVFGRPVRGMPHSTTNPMNYWRTTLADCERGELLGCAGDDEPEISVCFVNVPVDNGATASLGCDQFPQPAGGAVELGEVDC